jgi:hypothetical protein
MTDLRELVARAIDEVIGLGRDQRFQVTDAVIQALTEAGVLMPVLPEGLVVSRVFEHDYQIPGTRYGAVIYKPRPDGSWESPQQGDGPTIPAAIANTLAGGAAQ